MNKKGKEGGSTWFNRRQTEIPLFKINKKKKKERKSAGTLGESSGGTGHFAAEIRGICRAVRSWSGRESWAPLKFLFYVSVQAGVWAWGPALSVSHFAGTAHPEGLG